VFPNFRYHGNSGRSDVIFNGIGKLCDLKNSLIGATFTALCLILAELWLILCSKNRLPCNKGLSEANLDDTVKTASEKTQFDANVLLLSLKMLELLPFKVAVGRNANFQILGE